LTDEQLTAFATYQERLETPAARRLLRAVGEDTRVMATLSSDGVQGAVFGSRDQLAAIDMLLRSNESLVSYGRIIRDAELALEGTVHPRIFWERYWISVIAAGFVLLILLSWFKRLLFGRPTVVIHQAPSRK
jgi:hypothetical protein